jgi:surfeit locus 1 family protein
MRRLPLVPTIVVLAAVAVMIGLGIWQWQRAEWKDRLLAEYAANATLPALDLDPLLDNDLRDLPPLAFRRVLVTCRSGRSEPVLRGGASKEGVGGWNYLLSCRPDAEGLAGRLRVNAGWSRVPDSSLRPALNGLVAGRLGAVEEGEPITITAAQPVPPLAPGVAPRIEDVPNNHRAYVFQWFFFAAAALAIYFLALRQRLSREGPDPRSDPS